MQARRLSFALALLVVLAAPLALPLLCAADGHAGQGIWFVENVGQYDDQAQYCLLGADQTVWIAQDGLKIVQPALDKQGNVVKISFAGANPEPHIEPSEPIAARVSFLRGNDPSRWLTNVPVWQTVRYVDIYPGVDIVVSGDESGWTWAIAPNPCLEGTARTKAIAQVELEVKGGSLMEDRGALRIETAVGTLALPSLTTPPSGLLDQPTRVPVDNPAHLGYVTYLGGTDDEYVEDMAVDSAGCVYLVGSTASSDFPAQPGAYDTTFEGNSDVIVCKLAADGSSLVYATFLGGSDDDLGNGISLDGSGNVYLTGMTESSDFPTTEGVLGQYDMPRQDAFCAKLNAQGNGLLYSTYLGAGGNDHARAIAIDHSGSAYVTGFTTSESDPQTPEGFPIVAGSYVQEGPDILASENVFVCKLDPTAELLTYSFVMGTPDRERGTEIEVDAEGQAHVLGWTSHVSFTTTLGDFGNEYGGSLYDVFCLQVTADGSNLGYSRLIGGAQWDEPGDLALDRAGNAYISGWTGSHDFPVTAGAYQSAWLSEGTGDDIIYDTKAGFVLKLNPTGTALVYSTFVGGMDVDQVHGVAVDGEGNVYLSGDTASHDLPTTEDALMPTYCGTQSWGGDAFVCSLDPSGSSLTYGTYFGGTDGEAEALLALSPSGKLYVAGSTKSADLHWTDGAYDTTLGGGEWGDAFVAQIGPQAAQEMWRIILPVMLKS